MQKDKYHTAILLMAGSGSRFGSDLPKQYHNLSGKKIYLHTLTMFYNSDLFQEIILVCDAQFTHIVKAETKSFKNIKVICGGKTRQESSYQGLLACSKSCQYVMIHDAVRPLVSLHILKKNLEQVYIHQAVDTCIPTTDTIIQSLDQETIHSIPIRDHLLRGQTPQTFKFNLIKKAHETYKGQNASDDCILVSQLKHSIAIVKGEDTNIKITNSLDLYIAEHILRTLSVYFPSSKQSLKGKIYAVIGASGGIGQAICTQLETHQARVIRMHRSHADIHIDLLDKASIKKGFETLYKQHPEIDGLINAAGILYKRTLDKLSFQEIEDMLSVNLTGLILSCKLAKIKPKGHIINIASSSYFRGREEYGIYSSTKAAVVNFTQSLSEERLDLFVNTIAPQRTNTNMRRKNFPKESTKELLCPNIIGKKVIDLLQNTCLTGSLIEIKAP